MQRGGLLPAIALMGALVTVTAGCSAAGGTSAGGSRAGAADGGAAALAAAPYTPPPAVPVTGLTRGMRLPLEAYEETLPEYDEILKARFAIESTCMHGYGFDYHPRTDTKAVSYDGSNMARRYGLSDPALAARYGYGVPGFAQTQAPQPDPPLPPRENLVLTGSATPGGAPSPHPGTADGKTIPVGGCIGRADQQLTDPANSMLVNDLDQQSLAESMALPAVQTAIKNWSDCMRRSGYQVSSPLQTSTLTQQRHASPGDPADRQIAVADVACKSQTNLIGIWFTAESTIQKRDITANAARLRQDAATLAAAKKTADAVLGAGNS